MTPALLLLKYGSSPCRRPDTLDAEEENADPKKVALDVADDLYFALLESGMPKNLGAAIGADKISEEELIFFGRDPELHGGFCGSRKVGIFSASLTK